MVATDMGEVQHLGGSMARAFGDHMVANAIIGLRGFDQHFSRWASTILARDRPKIQGDPYYSSHRVWRRQICLVWFRECLYSLVIGW